MKEKEGHEYGRSSPLNPIMKRGSQASILGRSKRIKFFIFVYLHIVVLLSKETEGPLL